MTTGEAWLNGMYEHASVLEGVANDLKSLGGAFYRCGNAATCEELLGIAEQLKSEADKARTLTASKLNGDLAEAQRGTATLLKGMLGMAEEAKRGGGR